MKVYDCFAYNGEEDILELRLNILDKHVDYFVLCESTQAFSGKEKPAYYAENHKRFKKWEDKIINFTVKPAVFESAFERAAYQKNSIRLALIYCQPDDLIYYGDVDEIWTPQTEEGKLRQLNYSYYLNNRSSEEWQGTNVFRYRNIRNLNEVRADHSVVLDDGGWHFSNVGGLEMIKRKLATYDHQEYNNRKTLALLEDRMKDNEDYVGREVDWQGKPFEFWVDESELPKYLLDNKKKYATLFK